MRSAASHIYSSVTMKTKVLAVVSVILCSCPLRRSESNTTSSHGGDEENEESTTEDLEALSGDLVDILNKTLKNYDDEVRPGLFGPPTAVKVAMDVEGFLHVSEVDMDIKIDFYFYQEWRDERLKFTHPNVSENSQVSYVPLNDELSSKIWIPDTFFYNEKESLVHEATVPNRAFWWYPNGNIIQSIRMTLTASCPMDLSNFPLDTQICTITIGSYGMPDSHLIYQWYSDQALNFASDSLKLLQDLKLTAYRQRQVSVPYHESNYSTLKCDFLLQRSPAYYFVLVYFPSALIVIISWFAFWIQRDAAAERMALGVTSVLTITTLLLSSQASSPKISYVKAIDIYMGVCFAMVFASLLHSAFVGYLLKRAASKGASEKGKAIEDEEIELGDRRKSSAKSVNSDKKSPLMESITKCDVASRLLFPAVFTVFNIVYWVYYLNVSTQITESNWITSTIVSADNKTADITSLL